MTPTSYDTQLRIRRDAEERNRAQEELGLWMDGIGNPRSKPVFEKRKVDARGSGTFMEGKSKTRIPSNQSRYDEERLRGNNYFKQGKYQDAISCYTRCLGEKEGLASPIVYSNRAMAHLKLKHWTQAESDATSALAISNLHYKSYQRRSVARLSMGKLRAAMMDVCSAQDCYNLELKTKGNDDNKSEMTQSATNEMEILRGKVEKALVEAARRAPRRKLPIPALG